MDKKDKFRYSCAENKLLHEDGGEKSSWEIAVVNGVLQPAQDILHANSAIASKLEVCFEGEKNLYFGPEGTRNDNSSCRFCWRNGETYDINPSQLLNMSGARMWGVWPTILPFYDAFFFFVCF